MSSDRSAIALERLDEAADEDRLRAAAPPCDLAELASALAQVEALVAAGADEAPDAAAAIERIADIAFVLHEREVEPSLCDALDAAMREIGEANARNRANVQRAHEAAELLRALACRLDAMIAAQALQPATEAAPAPGAVQGLANHAELECADEFPAPVRLFDADIAEDSAFAQTVAALAESLPEAAAPAPSQNHAAAGAAPEAVTHSNVEAEQATTSLGARLQAAEIVSAAGQEPAPHQGVAAAGTAVPSAAAADFASLALSAGAAAVPAVDTRQSVDPDEDPGDLFEPMPDMRPAADAHAPVPAMSAIAAPAAAPAAGVAPQSPRGAAGAPAASRPAATDPLAPIRALSEEELIALFS
jgi:hypothetical protein